MTRRAPVAIAAVLVLALLAAVVLRSNDGDGGGVGGGGRDRPRAATATTVPESVARLQGEIERRLALPGDPVATPTAVDALQWGISRLLQSPAIEIHYSKEGTDPGPVQVTATVLPAKHALDQQRTMTLENGSVLTEDRRVVDGVVYVRTDDQLSPDLPAPWDRAPVADLPGSDVDRAFTAEGAAGSSIGALPQLLRTGPFAATRAVGSGDRATVYRLRAPTANGTPTAFEFTLGPGDVLTSLSTYGTVFVDGEALERAVVDIRYQPTRSRPITAPPAAELRR